MLSWNAENLKIYNIIKYIYKYVKFLRLFGSGNDRIRLQVHMELQTCKSECELEVIRSCLTAD